MPPTCRKPKEESWEERFVQAFPFRKHRPKEVCACWFCVKIPEIKSFISSEKEKSRLEGFYRGQEQTIGVLSYAIHKDCPSGCEERFERIAKELETNSPNHE